MKLIMMMMMMTMMMMMIMEDDDDDDNDDGQDDNNAALIKQKQKPCHRSVAKLVYNWLECYPMLCTHTVHVVEISNQWLYNVFQHFKLTDLCYIGAL